MRCALETCTMNLTIEASRLFLSIRLGRWEFFAQPKSAPGYDTAHVRGPLALVRTGGAAPVSYTHLDVYKRQIYSKSHQRIR